jgi:hypothetical protein
MLVGIVRTVDVGAKFDTIAQGNFDVQIDLERVGHGLLLTTPQQNPLAQSL